MSGFVKLLILVGAVVALIFIMEILQKANIWLHKRVIRPLIGSAGSHLKDMLKSDYYVSIDGKVYRFSHIAQSGESVDPIRPPSYKNSTYGGELAFWNPRGIGYIYRPVSALEKCDFIYGKHWVKWAASVEKAETAEGVIKKAKRNCDV